MSVGRVDPDILKDHSALLGLLDPEYIYIYIFVDLPTKFSSKVILI